MDKSDGPVAEQVFPFWQYLAVLSVSCVVLATHIKCFFAGSSPSIVIRYRTLVEVPDSSSHHTYRTNLFILSHQRANHAFLHLPYLRCPRRRVELQSFNLTRCSVGGLVGYSFLLESFSSRVRFCSRQPNNNIIAHCQHSKVNIP